MRPVIFGECFGWLHAAPVPATLGIVLCAPFGFDVLCTHRGWRQLAERLAASGLPTLRFDYPGTGDAAGVESDPARIDAWLDSIDAAIHTLRERTGVTRIALCGLRLGGLLAARAAERRGDVEALALLAPVVSGRQYVRELKANRQRWLSTPSGLNADPLPASADYAEAYGFGIHGDDVKQLASIDLTKATGRLARRVLILDSLDRTRIPALAAACTASGSDVTTGPFDECDRFLLEALHSELPGHAFGQVVEWFGQGARDGRDGRDEACRPVPTAPATRATAMRVNACRAWETPVSFGPAGSAAGGADTCADACADTCAGPWFGIHCVPDRVDATVPAVLFVNTGASHHIGDGRMFVLFARRLAAQGIPSLRMDLAGLGDSVPAAANVSLDTIYSDASAGDVMAGADWLAAHGCPRVVVFGVCGGAFSGLHAASRHPGIVGCVSVNLQKFIWEGEARASGTGALAQSRLYWRSAFSLAKWRDALQGRSDPWRAARAVSRRIGRRVRARVGDGLARCGIGGANPVRTLIRGLDAKGVQVRLIYGEFDVGLDELKIHFGVLGRALRRYPTICVRPLPKVDHALYTDAAREAVMRDTEAWLTGTMREALPLPLAQIRPAGATPAGTRQGAGGRYPAGSATISPAAPEPVSGRQNDTAPRGAHLPGVGS